MRSRNNSSNEYELLDALPDNANEMALPNYKITFKELFFWRKWQGFSWIRFYYITAMVFIILIFAFEIIWSFSRGAGYIILSIIFMPMLAIVCIAGFRILAEVLLTVLILPHQLHQMNRNINKLRLSVPIQPAQIQLGAAESSSINQPIQVQQI